MFTLLCRINYGSRLSKSSNGSGAITTELEKGFKGVTEGPATHVKIDQPKVPLYIQQVLSNNASVTNAAPTSSTCTQNPASRSLAASEIRFEDYGLESGPLANVTEKPVLNNEIPRGLRAKGPN